MASTKVIGAALLILLVVDRSLAARSPKELRSGGGGGLSGSGYGSGMDQEVVLDMVMGEEEVVVVVAVEGVVEDLAHIAIMGQDMGLGMGQVVVGVKVVKVQEEVLATDQDMEVGVDTEVVEAMAVAQAMEMEGMTSHETQILDCVAFNQFLAKF